jgi:uncharacterized linocin/CFP29 family protein
MSAASLDYVQNGQFHGSFGSSLATKLIKSGGDIGVFRPYCSEDENDPRSFITLNSGTKQEKVVLTNADSPLRPSDWLELDQAVVKVAKPMLRVYGDLRSRGLQYVIPNGMGKTVLQTERMTDITPASINMSGVVDSASDRPLFDAQNLPLPIIHKDFQFDARQVMVSRNSGNGIDTSTAEAAARRVAEGVEQLLLGVASTYQYGGGVVYGLTNFPQRMTKTLTAPTAGGWTPHTTVSEVLAMRLQSQLAFHYGPWKLYISPNWDAYMDDDYSAAKGDNTLRQRLMGINGIEDVVTADYLQFISGNPYTMLLVQQTSDVVRAVVGMDITTLQWETHGGMMLNFKVMCIMVPQIRADHNNKTGIVHGSIASS